MHAVYVRSTKSVIILPGLIILFVGIIIVLVNNKRYVHGSRDSTKYEIVYESCRKRSIKNLCLHYALHLYVHWLIETQLSSELWKTEEMKKDEHILSILKFMLICSTTYIANSYLSCTSSMHACTSYLCACVISSPIRNHIDILSSFSRWK